MDFYKTVTEALKKSDGEFSSVNTAALKDFVVAAERGFVAFGKQFASKYDATCKSCRDQRTIDLPMVLKKKEGCAEEILECYQMPCPDCRADIKFQIDGHHQEFELFVRSRSASTLTYDVMHGLWFIMAITFDDSILGGCDKERIAALTKKCVEDFLKANGHPKDEPDELPNA